jgi:hypothetical protein
VQGFGEIDNGSAAFLVFFADVLQRKPFVTVAEIEQSVIEGVLSLDLCS